MSTYNIVAATAESTVVVKYEPTGKRSSEYQSEAALENEFIAQLMSQGYERIAIKSDTELVANLRVQLEQLNQYRFSDGEWQRFFEQNITSSNEGIVE